MPKRLLKTRQIALDEQTIYVGRPTRWGNPFKVGGANAMTSEIAVRAYRALRFPYHSTIEDAACLEQAFKIQPLGFEDAGCACGDWGGGCWCEADFCLCGAVSDFGECR